MKKLKKANLQQLAERMPVMGTEETAECIGGYHFFDSNGTYFGRAGSGEEIYITTAELFNSSNSHPDNLVRWSKPTSAANPSHSALTNMVRNARQEIGIPNHVYLEVYSAVYTAGVSGGLVYNTDIPAAYDGNTLYMRDYLPNFNSMDSLRYLFRYAQESGLFVSGDMVLVSGYHRP